MEAKGKERAAGFKAKKTQKSKSQQPFEVNVQIGIMQKKMDFCALPGALACPSRLAQAWVLKSCWQKHARKLSGSTKMYSRPMITLVYPDRTEVKNLPGSTESFILKKYKEELGKPYFRIYFYLT